MIRTILAFAALLQQLAPAHAHGRPVTATVYDGWYNGRTTYCGQTYQHWGVSAAHPWLPCGTQVRVSHQGRTLTVPITDRCDCSSIAIAAVIDVVTEYDADADTWDNHPALTVEERNRSMK